MNDQTQRPVYDRTVEDVGNIVEFGHINVRVPDQQLATVFYVSGLGMTRDPYLMTSIDNMWINVGAAQFHLPHGPAQVLNGTAVLVVPDLAALHRRLDRVSSRLKGTHFAYRATNDSIEVTCPWGNRMRLHAPDAARFGAITLGMPEVEIDAPPGRSEAIARFYHEVIDTPVATGEDARGRFVRVPAGTVTHLVYRESDRTSPPYDGHHVQVSFADFSGPHKRLGARGLITEESDQHQYRFQDIVDCETGEVIVSLEHEVRSMRHPLFARPLINRNPQQSNIHYAPGHENWAWNMAAE